MMSSFAALLLVLNVAHSSIVKTPAVGVVVADPSAHVKTVPVTTKAKVQPHPVALSAVQSNHTANSTVSVVKDALQIELSKAEEEVQAKQKEMKVQAGLLKEKEVAASQTQKRAILLRGRVEKLQKEADVAAEMAQEKSEAASKVQAKMNATEQKAQQFLLEEREMERVVNQTRKEELALEHNVSMIEQMVEMKKEGRTGLPKVQPVEKQTSVLPAVTPVETPKATLLAAGTKVASTNVAKTDSQLSEAYKKLMEENDKLKHDKAILEEQLKSRAAATEKKKLKQKLKNRLALADRHMKMQKSLIHAAH